MTLPTITATGNLTADPVLRFTRDGKAVTTLTVACNDRRKSSTGEWVDGDTTFLDVQLWTQDAEQAAEHLRKGQRVAVTGRLRQRSYEAKDGSKRYAWEVVQATVTMGLPRQQQAAPMPEVAPF